MKTLGPRNNGERVATEHALVRARNGKATSRAKSVVTLCVDIGGTGIKVIALDAKGRPLNQRVRELTPKPATPAAVVKVLRRMVAEQPRFDRVSVGFPGVVVNGVVHTAVNLGTEYWAQQDLRSELEKASKRPVRVINDADLQGYGVIEGRGVELVLTLGTGLGSALFSDGRLVPNLELGHHPFKKGKTYEERLSDAELKQHGKKDWSRRVEEAIETLEPIFNYRVLHLGGGNAEHLRVKLPKNVKIFTNVDGMTGGFRLWEHD
jgi:polyphosphate glucokinase